MNIEKITKLWTGAALAGFCIAIIASKMMAEEYGTEHQLLNAIFWEAIAFLAITFALWVAQTIQIMVETRRSRKATQWLLRKKRNRKERKVMSEGERRLLIDDILDGKYKSYEEYVADVGRGPDTFGRAEFQFLAALVDAVEIIEKEKERKG